MTKETAPTRALHRVRRAASDLRWASHMSASFPASIRQEIAALHSDLEMLATDMRAPARSIACSLGQQERRRRAAERKRKRDVLLDAATRMERAVNAVIPGAWRAA